MTNFALLLRQHPYRKLKVNCFIFIVVALQKRVVESKHVDYGVPHSG